MAKKSNKKRSDGRIAVQVYLGKDENGKRKYKTVYGKTQKEANQKADEIRSAIGKGLDVTKDNNSYAEWVELFLSSQKLQLTESEYELKKTRAHYFSEFFGDTPLKAITVYSVETALNYLAKYNPSTGKPSAAKTIRGYKQICSQVFKFAIKNRVIDFNPCDYAETPSGAGSTERRSLSAEERERIINVEHRAKRAAMIAMFCGLRRGELTALTWSDIDFPSGNISVSKSYDFKSNEIKSTKTQAGIRIIPMPKILSDFLSEETREGVYVCCNARGKMMSAEAWKKLNNSLLIDLEMQYGTGVKKNKFAPTPSIFTIQTFGWHDLRHTYATILYEAGVDVLTAQYLLGHASPETTMKIYTHLSEEKKDKSIDKLNDFLECKSNASQTG